MTAKENKSNTIPEHKHTGSVLPCPEKTNPLHIDHVLCICIEACNRAEEAGQLSCPALPCPLRHPGRLRPGGTRKHQGK